VLLLFVVLSFWPAVMIRLDRHFTTRHELIVWLLITGTIVACLFLLGGTLAARQTRQTMKWMRWIGCVFALLLVILLFGSLPGSPDERDSDWQRMEMNSWVRYTGTIVACLLLLGIAIRAAGTFTSERH